MDKQAIDAKVREGFPFTHRWHNRFHLEMPFGLINDPNGLVYFQGEYHIFYQWNPLACVHKNKSWAHTKTKDFVHYTVPELAMWPTDAHDKDGCYSGCGFADGDNLRVFYTCNAKDEQGIRTPAQRLGTLKDGKIIKEEIAVPTNEKGFTAHFRDPYVFYRHGKKYFVLGAQAEDERGTVVVYREDDGAWKFMGELKTEVSRKEFAYMWECPGLLQLGAHDVLLLCPQGLKAEDYRFQNLYQSGYLVGHLSLDSMEFFHGNFQELDRGFDFYAPQVFNNAGRHILMGWMGMPDEEAHYPTAEEGWLFSLTLPRTLSLWQGHIYAQPATELHALRRQETMLSVNITEAREFNAPIADGAEIALEISLGEAKVIESCLHFGAEKLVFRYDRTTQVMEIDRNGMNLGGRGVRRFKVFTDGHLALQFFVDRTAIEVFFQHGEETASLFVFPETDAAREFTINADAPLDSIGGQIWELNGFEFA